MAAFDQALGRTDRVENSCHPMFLFRKSIIFADPFKKRKERSIEAQTVDEILNHPADRCCDTFSSLGYRHRE
jgi:hypothetical protein